jgi:DNA-binding GntR family transcriptional regulator
MEKSLAEGSQTFEEDLARMTGCTRETVNRTLNRLSVERRLLRRGRRYVVPYLG